MQLSKSSIFFLLTLLFLVTMLLLSWPWYIVDQDDPFTIAYHYWGRNWHIQTAYQPYDSMCDYLLSWLPSNYKVLYITMLLWTFVSGCVIYFMFIKIASIFTNINTKRLYLYGFFMLLAIPGFDYLFLSYKSSFIGFAFIITAHYILINSFKNKGALQIAPLLLSAALFGLGAACRWNLVVYGITVFADIAYLQYKQTKWKQWGKIAAWAIAAILFFLLFLYISGYDIGNFIRVIGWGKKYIKGSDFQLVFELADSIALFTPITIICLLAGVISIAKNYRSNTRIVLLIIMSALPFVYLGMSASIKYLLTFFPALFIIFTIGADHIYNTVAQRYQFLRPLFWLLLLLPWFVGVWVYSNTTKWGPGFSIKEQTKAANTFGEKLDERFKANTIKLKFDAGFAISSSEATIPLWGHFYTLFCGRLNQLDKKMSDEADTVIAIAGSQHINIYSDFPTKVHPMILNSLCKEGYQTSDSGRQKGAFTIRHFYKNNDTVILSLFNNNARIEDFESLGTLVHTKRFIAYFTYSSLLTDFMNKAPRYRINIVRQTGPFSCIFEFN